MDTLNFLVVENTGEKPKCILVTSSRPEATAAFKTASRDSKIDSVRLYGSAAPTHRWSPSKTAKIVAENNKRLAAEAKELADAEKNQAKADLEKAEADAKEAKAKLKELASKE